MLAPLLLAGALMAFSGAHNLGRFASWAGLPAVATADDLAYVKSYGRQKLVTFGGGQWGIVGGPEADTETAMQRAGVVANGTADDASELQAAMDDIAVAGKRALWFPPPGLDIRINSGLTCTLPAAIWNWNGTRLLCSNMSSGTAMTLTGQSASPYNRISAASPFSNLVIDLPDSDSTSVDGLYVGDNTKLTGHSEIGNVSINYGRDQLVFGAHVYIQAFRNLFCNFAHRRGLYYPGVVDSGESINFFGGSFSDASNAAGTATGIYIPAGVNPEIVLHGTSNDYCDLGFDIGSGKFLALGAHFESKSNNPHGKCKYTGGQATTIVELLGCTVAHGQLSDGTEDAAGRSSFFLIDSASGDRLTFIARGTLYAGYRRSATEFVTYTGSGLPKIVVDDHHFEQDNNYIGRPSDRTSLIAGNWATSGSNSYQDFGVDPGKTALVRMLVDNGRLPSLLFLDHVGGTITTKALTSVSGEPTTNANRSGAYAVPPGARTARLQIATANVGDLSNTQAWVL